MSRQHALEIFNAAVNAVKPGKLIPGLLERDERKIRIGDEWIKMQENGKLIITGAGKAAAAMALEAEKIFTDMIHEGLVVTKYQHGLPLEKIRCFEAGHPVPDENSVMAAHAIRELMMNAGENDVVINFISGGASALLGDIPEEISLEEYQALNSYLLKIGADIHEINTVRKHLSFLKGGQCARYAYPAALYSLILSDVTGDPLEIIASGPTVPDPSTFQDAWSILEKYGIQKKMAPAIRNYLQNGMAGKIPETPGSDHDTYFSRTKNILAGNNTMALDAAATRARELGYNTVILTNVMQGEAKIKAREFVQHLVNYKGHRPACLLMGGETTVRIQGKGKGGRNQEFALAALNEMITLNPQIDLPTILSAGTDGTDGPTDATGAVVDADLIRTAAELNLDVKEFLRQNDSWHFFQKAGRHIITGPTYTNVMDVVIGLVH